MAAVARPQHAEPKQVDPLVRHRLGIRFAPLRNRLQHDLGGDPVEDMVQELRIEIGAQDLDGLQKASVPPLGPDAEEEPVKKQTTHLERARQYQKEHGCSTTDALKATADKRK